MRVLVALAAALALAGCQVDLEGAACEAPGAEEQCPSGQRCGNDLRCSARAAACADRCAPGEVKCSDTDDVVRCQPDDPVCGAWVVEVDCEPGFVCRDNGADPACFCPANLGTEVIVDAEAGVPADGPAPTGVRTPAACRFPNLAAGLAAARDVGAPVVIAAGAPAVYPLGATLAVPAGVTLRGDDDPAAPERRVLSLEGDLAVGVTLAEGAALSGFTVRNGSAPATAIGVKVACAAGATARIEDVVIGDASASGATALAQGVRVEGACPVELTRVAVTGASGPGLLVAREAPDQTVVAADSTFEGNGVGVRLTRGDLSLRRVLVKGNAAEGVVAAGEVDTDRPRLTIEQSTVRANGDTAIFVANNAQRVRLVGNRICENAAVTARGIADVSRTVGGVYLGGTPPADVAFTANFVHSNEGDQVMVAGASSAWPLDGAPAGATACGAGRNVFAGYLDTTRRGIFAAYARVSARWNGWEGIAPAPPPTGSDYEAYPVGSAWLDVGTSATPQQVCAPPTAAELLCD